MQVPVSVATIAMQRLERCTRVLPTRHSQSLLWGRQGGESGIGLAQRTSRGRIVKRTNYSGGAESSDSEEAIEESRLSLPPLNPTQVTLLQELQGLVLPAAALVVSPTLTDDDLEELKKMAASAANLLRYFGSRPSTDPAVAARVARGVPFPRRGPAANSDEAISKRLWAEFVQFCAQAARAPCTPQHVAFADYVRWDLEL